MRERSASAAQSARERKGWRAQAVWGIATLLAAAPLLAGTNVLENGEFSEFTVEPWTASLGKVFLSDVDHAGNQSSGSALLVDDNGTTFYGATLISECVAVQGGAQVDIGAWLKGGSRVPGGSRTRIRRSYFSDGDCTTYLSFAGSDYGSVPSAWTRITSPGTAPSSARSARMFIDGVSGSNGALDLLADGLSMITPLEPLPSTIFVSGFESGTAGWIVVP